VFELLSSAAGDGRLTLEEHAERAERAHAARTLGDLAELTVDLAAPAAQPIRLDGRRAVAGVLTREKRDGRWVVPASFPVAAIFGEVILDLRDAVLQSQRTVVFATVIGGQLELIVPEGVEVTMSGRSMLGRQVVRGARGSRPDPRAAGPPPPGQPSIEIRSMTLGGKIRVTTPRRARSRWRLGRPGR
jgi:Domain of unknown function (DUF1707)/Cell wall-active antibiotics response 4TMS YvqF